MDIHEWLCICHVPQITSQKLYMMSSEMPLKSLEFPVELGQTKAEKIVIT